jgi:Na+/H+ antiporter NhaC
MNTAENGENKVKNGEKRKRSTARFWFVVLLINLFGVFYTTHSVTRIFTAIGVIGSIVVLFQAWRADKTQAKVNDPQTSTDQ